MADDSELLRRYTESHSEEAFSEFVRNHLALVYSAAYRQVGRDGQMAEDITQVVFAAASRKASKLIAHPCIAAWLYQATRYAAIDCLRRRQRQQRLERAASVMSDNSVEDHLDWESLSPALDCLIGTLAERDRQAIVLRFFCNRSHQQIAEELQISEDAARMRIERALEKLRRQLSGKARLSSIGALATILAEQGLMATPAGLTATVTSAALAAAPATSGIAGGVLLFMTTSKATAVFAAATLIGAGIAWREYKTALASQLALLNASQQNIQLRHELDVSNSARQRMQMRIGQMVGQSHNGEPTQPTPPNGTRIVRTSDIIKDHPEYAELHAKDIRRQVLRRYGAALMSLNLPADQLSRLKDLLVERETSISDAIAAAAANGLAPQTPEWQQAINQAIQGTTQEIDSDLQAYGNTTFAMLAALSAANSGVEENYEPDLLDAGVPLSASQESAIAQAIANASYRSPTAAQHPPGYNTTDPATGLTPKDAYILSQVSSALSPTQLQIFQGSLMQHMQIQAIQDSYNQNGTVTITP